MTKLHNLSIPTSFVISGLDRAAAFLAALTLVGVPTAALVTWFIFPDQELVPLVLSIGLPLALACCLFVLQRYRLQPATRQRRPLQEEAVRIGSEIQYLQNQLDHLRKHRRVIDGERRTQIETLKPGYREKSADLSAIFLNIDQRERDEIRAATEAYQEAFVRSAIAEASIDRVVVPGFTAQILEKLENAGILTAVDITTERLQAIPDLDPFLIHELDLWRQHIESEADARKPLSLPSARLDAILSRFREERLAIMASMESLVYGMQNDVLKIENGVGERLIQANAFEDDLSRRLAELGEIYRDFTERLHPMDDLTFSGFIKACFSK